MEKLIDMKNPLMSTRFDVICKSLCRNRISPKYIPHVSISLLMAAIFYPCTLIEAAHYKKLTKDKPLKEPLFILGFWRSGTTLLQNVLSRDPAKGSTYPLPGYSYNTVLMKPILEKSQDQLLSEVRVMDNMEYKRDLPIEDYVLLANNHADSMWSANLYPKNAQKYMEYAFIDELPDKKRKLWEKRYDQMLRKLAYKQDCKPMVLKSPDATGRAYALKQMYPDAKFVNIYRNPYNVIRSTIHMYTVMFKVWGLQKVPDAKAIEDFAFDGFKRIYKKYFSDLEKLPKEDIIEIKFEEFEKDPFPLVKSIYEKFNWDYSEAEPVIKTYWESLEGYQKNDYDYPSELIKRVNDELGFYFEHYGYEKIEVE